MYFNDDSVLPENQQPLIINAAPFGPEWMPSDWKDYPDEIPVSLKAQVQRVRDCYNAGATMLHVHVRDPKTGKISTDFSQFNDLLGELKAAVPKMILSVGGSIAFTNTDASKGGSWTGDADTRHMLAELTPRPEQVTIMIGNTMMDIAQMFTKDDGQGTSLENPQVAAAWVGMFTDALPSFYIKHLKRLRASGIQPYFMLAHVHQLEIVERLIRQGFYMGPLNHNLTSIGGGACGRNPYDWMEYLRRSPQGSILHFQNSMRGNLPMHAVAMALGVHIRLGIEDNIWGKKGERFTTLQQIEWVTTLAKHLGREVATAEEARAIMKIGTWYNSVDETLLALGLPPNRKGGHVGFLGYGKDGEGLISSHPQAGDSHPMFEGIPEARPAGAGPKI